MKSLDVMELDVKMKCKCLVKDKLINSAHNHVEHISELDRQHAAAKRMADNILPIQSSSFDLQLMQIVQTINT
jgi:hypothetical protein